MKQNKKILAKTTHIILYKMSKCRVTVEYGSKPYILIAPHGYQGDDFNTALICERTASVLDCYSIINYGWKKTNHVDVIC